MDSQILIPVLTGIVAIIPGVWALIVQSNKDKRQAQADAQKAVQDAAMSMLEPLQRENARLLSRNKEMEDEITKKSDKIEELENDNFEKDKTIRRLSLDNDDMKRRLSVFESAQDPPVQEKKTTRRRRTKKSVSQDETEINKNDGVSTQNKSQGET